VPADCDPLAGAMPEGDVLRAMAELRRSYESAAERLPLASDYIARRVSSAQ
jgi:hypothetical protein